MAFEFDFSPLLQASVTRDTIVALTMPAQRTAFDYASGTLQILVLLVGFVALGATAALALTVRRVVNTLQGTVDRLIADTRPLLQQATRVSEDARDVVKTVRREVDRLAEASSEMSARILDLSDAAEQRIDEVNALIDVLRDEVQDTALSAAATVRGVRVGAAALGMALGGRSAQRLRKSERNDEELEDEEYDDDEEFDDAYDEEDEEYEEEGDEDDAPGDSGEFDAVDETAEPPDDAALNDEPVAERPRSASARRRRRP